MTGRCNIAIETNVFLTKVAIKLRAVQRIEATSCLYCSSNLGCRE
ncbi:Uncharacterised protein [Vibrio cholerae]|nr:Uncharacterised protein [Vibrio cholerae]